MEELQAKILEALGSKDLWLNFDTGEFVTDNEIRTMIKTKSLLPQNVSSRPDLFPVFGNMKAAVQTLHEMVNEVDESEPDAFKCHKGVKGFRNPSNSCFMDSTLMAMFFLQNSPFYDTMFTQELIPGDELCDEDPILNLETKEKVRRLMKSDVDRIINGEKGYACNKLRTLIGKTCKKNGEDMSRGRHDPSEFLIRLFDIVNYRPMMVQETKSRSESEDGPWVVSSKQVIPRGWLEMSAASPGKLRVSWPQTWNSEITAVEVDDVITDYLKPEVRILSADVIIVYVNRNNFDADGRVFYTKNTVKVDRTMDVDFLDTKKTYTLMSAVYVPHEGHYASILKCDGKWYVYDDMMAGSEYQKKKPLGKLEVEAILTTKGVLLFYY